MASVFPNVSRPGAGGFLDRLTHGQVPPNDQRLHSILSAIDNALVLKGPPSALVGILEDSKRTLFEFLRGHCQSEVVAKALTLKAINICLAKHHFRARSTTLLSRPFGLIIDPSNSCNLACPGCVHSTHAKELKIFQWGTGTLPIPRLSKFMTAYGPYAIHANFCNYGEPLVNPDTPRFVREAKGNLVGTMLSTNLSLPRLDTTALVASGLDYMIVSVDGATQPVYQKFRKKGHLDVVVRNLERLVQAKKDQGRKTPIIVWRFLTFQHNVHEIPLAMETARQIGVDQFVTAHPYDVSWDDPEVHVADVPLVDRLFNPRAQLDILDNWNAFPDDLNTESIDREFNALWMDPATLPPEMAGNGTGSTCNWLYKSISLDAGGRIFPCCASPRPDADLVFAEFDHTPVPQIFNSEKYRLSRLSLVDIETYRKERDQAKLTSDPYCAKCDWDKEATNTRGDNISTYFKGASRELFNRESLAILSAW